MRKDLLLSLCAEGERAESFEIFFYLGNPWPWPVGAEKRLLSDLVEAWKIFEQRLRWNSADIKENIRMAPE